MVLYYCKNSKQLSSLPNDLKLRINAINQLETYVVIAKNTAISSVANTINKLHIQSDMHLIHKQNLYHDKQDEIDTLFMNTIFPYKTIFIILH